MLFSNWAIGAALLLAGTSLPARETVTSSATILSAAGAKAAIASAERAAADKGLKLSIAVVDAAGDLLAFQRMAGASPISVEVSIEKARTAALAGISTRMLQDQVNAGSAALLSLRNLTPIQGGMPIILNGQLLGGIGASGASPGDDELIAQSGATAIIPPGRQ